MADPIEKGVTRRHTFFCTDRERHTTSTKVIDVSPKTISVFGRQVQGWIVTTEEPVIDKTISLKESLDDMGVRHDPE
ncbi:MAG: hypothetical protein HN712_17945 [Gemmatimonadetes bacterium]|jgi:hypothetical protein|nr:hypothetical protein [Gemmatimonadota bacterium]MBT6146335.1 hypothetical protein [Gemmatimonadota bacterium]MBT7862205.1 hypothetical protein [Gemmatimonadota bacterium]